MPNTYQQGSAYIKELAIVFIIGLIVIFGYRTMSSMADSVQCFFTSCEKEIREENGRLKSDLDRLTNQLKENKDSCDLRIKNLKFSRDAVVENCETLLKINNVYNASTASVTEAIRQRNEIDFQDVVVQKQQMMAKAPPAPTPVKVATPVPSVQESEILAAAQETGAQVMSKKAVEADRIVAKKQIDALWDLHCATDEPSCERT